VFVLRRVKALDDNNIFPFTEPSNLMYDSPSGKSLCSNLSKGFCVKCATLSANFLDAGPGASFNTENKQTHHLNGFPAFLSKHVNNVNAYIPFQRSYEP
jgi:hypothetical protein